MARLWCEITPLVINNLRPNNKPKMLKVGPQVCFSLSHNGFSFVAKWRKPKIKIKIKICPSPPATCKIRARNPKINLSAANSLVMDNVPQRQGPGIDAGFRRLNSLRRLCCSLAVSCFARSLSLSPFAVAPSRHLLLCFFFSTKTKRIPA